jgi:hypothetical protein
VIFWRPPLTLERWPLAVLKSPPRILEESPLAVLPSPPLTLVPSLLIVLNSPATKPPKAARRNLWKTSDDEVVRPATIAGLEPRGFVVADDQISKPGASAIVVGRA